MCMPFVGAGHFPMKLYQVSLPEHHTIRVYSIGLFIGAYHLWSVWGYHGLYGVTKRIRLNINYVSQNTFIWKGVVSQVVVILGISKYFDGDWVPYICIYFFALRRKIARK